MNKIKVISIVIFSLITLTIGCKKSNTANPMQFTFSSNINTMGNITILPGQTIQSNGLFDFFIEQTGGNAEDITLSVNGLPAGVTFTPSLPQNYVASLFTLNQATTISLVSLNANSSVVGGTYTIVITAKTASGVAKSINFNLIVQTCNVSETSIVGNYNGNWSILSMSLGNDVLTIADSANNRVYIHSNTFFTNIFKATLSGYTLTTDSIFIASANVTGGTITNVRAKAIGTFQCNINPLNITLNIAKGTYTVGSTSYPLNGQTLTGTFTKQ